MQEIDPIVHQVINIDNFFAVFHGRVKRAFLTHEPTFELKEYDTEILDKMYHNFWLYKVRKNYICF